MKIEGIFGKKFSPKVLKEVVFFRYSIDNTNNNFYYRKSCLSV